MDGIKKLLMLHDMHLLPFLIILMDTSLQNGLGKNGGGKATIKMESQHHFAMISLFMEESCNLVMITHAGIG